MSRYTQQDQYTVGGLNAENESIEQAIADTLSRKGDTPNAMETDLDMNSHRILNLPPASTLQEPATLEQLKSLIGSTNTTAFGYLAEDATADDIEAACLKHMYVVFPENGTVTVDRLDIPEASKCRGWFLNGCTLHVTDSEIEFNNEMDVVDLQGGAIKGGLKLAKVALASGKDQTSVTVYQGHGIVVGDYVTSSLDNSYLPNSSSRTGYQEEGDFNRVTSVVSNGDGTDTINLTYRFFRSENSNVYSGWLENAWISANADFRNTGIRFNKGQPTVCNGVLEFFQGYVIGLDEGAPNNRKSVLRLKDISIDNTFIDIIRCRCFGLELDHVTVSRQYDFSKQLIVADMPKEGFIQFKNGCIVQRQNRDAEIFCIPFDAIPDGVDQENPQVILDGTNLFDGSQPSDLPTSDFSGGQLYWGRSVAITDCLHWYVPDHQSNDAGGFVSKGDRFSGYLRSIYGTSFAAKQKFNSKYIYFENSYTECDPVYIEVTGEDNLETTKNNPCYLKGGHYEARGTVTFNRGVLTYADDCEIVLPDANVGTDFIPSNVNLSNFQMSRGKLDGRFRVSNNSNYFKDVLLPYRGTYTGSEKLNQPIFSCESLGNRFENQFVLELPREGVDFQSTGQPFEVFDGYLPVGSWLVSNTSDVSVNPPSFKFRVERQAEMFKYGSVGGFSKRYNIELYRGRSTIPPSPSRGLFSGLLAEYDSVYRGDTHLREVIDSSQQFLTTNSNTTGIASEITLDGTVSGTPDYVGVFDSNVGNWYYYLVASSTTSSVTPQNTYINSSGSFRDYSVGDRVTLIYLQGSAATAPENYAHYKGSFDGTGALLPEIYLNISNVLSVSGGVWSLDFNTPFFVDNYNTTVYDPASPTTAFTVVPRLSLNNVARNNMGFMIFKADANGALTQVTTNSGLSGCVFEFYAQEADYRGNV